MITTKRDIFVCINTVPVTNNRGINIKDVGVTRTGGLRLLFHPSYKE